MRRRIWRQARAVEYTLRSGLLPYFAVVQLIVIVVLAVAVGQEYLDL